MEDSLESAEGTTQAERPESLAVPTLCVSSPRPHLQLLSQGLTALLSHLSSQALVGGLSRPWVLLLPSASVLVPVPVPVGVP